MKIYFASWHYHNSYRPGQENVQEVGFKIQEKEIVQVTNLSFIVKDGEGKEWLVPKVSLDDMKRGPYFTDKNKALAYLRTAMQRNMDMRKEEVRLIQEQIDEINKQL